MGLFSKKTPTFEEILAALDGLSEDEISKVKAKMDGLVGEGNKSEETEQGDETNGGAEESATASDEAPETAEETEEPNAEESEEDPNAEGEESMPPEVNEEEQTAEEPETPADNLGEIRELINALTARVDSMSESHGKLSEQVAEIISRNDNLPFGNHKQHPPEGNADEGSESAVMRSYNSKQTNFR